MKKIFVTLAIMMLLLASNLFAQEITPGKEIDLGLPSGTIWAGWNVGATSPEEYGGYYALGETEEKSDYTHETYKYYDSQTGKYTDIGTNISGTQYDVARQKWGGSWRMPTEAEIDELTSKCTWTWYQYKGVWGQKVTGPNGNSIFLPAAGERYGISLYYDGSYGNYWSATLREDEDGNCGVAWGLNFSNGNYYSDDNFTRLCGYSVRPVKGLLPTTFDGFDIFSSLEKDEMIAVKGGTFTMGATSEQGSDYYSEELPTHQVTLSDYYIGKYEVTQQLWEYVMSYSGTAADGTTMSAYGSGVWLGSNPSSSIGKGDYYPAYYVSYNDIVNVFLPRLNKITGLEFRLPTEVEWEYAARGGNKSQGYKYSGGNSIGEVAWYTSNSSSSTHEVGTKSPNELGLYDMSGNVWEWCSDWYSSSYYSSSPSNNPTGPTSGSSRVLRGGSWGNFARGCRVSDRSATSRTSASATAASALPSVLRFTAYPSRLS